MVDGQDIQGFVPISHLVDTAEPPCEENREEILKAYIGRELKLKVIECNPNRERVVLSERAALAGPGRRIELIENLEPGSRVKGQVTTITTFGAFVDLGGVEGLIHISELSWGRVSHPSDVLSVEDEIEVHVLDIDPESCQVALSLKRLKPNPWKTIQTHFQAGQIVKAVITNIVPYGAFARLEIGLDGLIHNSEIPTEHNDREELFVKGQSVNVEILHIDPEQQQIGLRLHSIEGETM